MSIVMCGISVVCANRGVIAGRVCSVDREVLQCASCFCGRNKGMVGTPPSGVPGNPRVLAKRARDLVSLGCCIVAR